MGAGKILVAECNGAYILKLIGDVRVTLCATVDEFMEKMFTSKSFSSVMIDLSSTEGIDSTTLGLLAKLAIQAKKRFRLVPVIISSNPSITRILESMGFDRVFDIRDHMIADEQELQELPQVDCEEPEVCQKVIEAHRVLMGMNESNRAEFRELVEALEGQA